MGKDGGGNSQSNYYIEIIQYMRISLMKYHLSYNDFLRIAKNFKEAFLNFNLPTEHPYYATSVSMLESEMNDYVNYVNFREIYELLKERENLKLIDVGCGIGDKAYIIKRLSPTFEVIGFETFNYDDTHHQETNPSLFFKSVYESLATNISLVCTMYDGAHLPLADASVDVILLYAVIEHISPEHREDFLKEMNRVLKPRGMIIIARCPRYWGLMEYISRKRKLGAHPWVLKKSELLGYFDTDKYKVRILKRMNNAPNNRSLTRGHVRFFIWFDQCLSWIRWPFSTDYFLVIQKHD